MTLLHSPIAVEWLSQKINQSLSSQKTPRTSASVVSYGVFIVSIWKNTVYVIMALHNIDDLVQDHNNPSALAMDLPQSCAKPLM